MGETEPQPVRGHRVDGLYPQHPRRSALPGPTRRSLGWEVTRESPWRVTEGVPTKRGGAASTLWGEESVMLRGGGRAPPLGLALTPLTARLRPRYRRCLRPSD